MHCGRGGGEAGTRQAADGGGARRLRPCGGRCRRGGEGVRSGPRVPVGAAGAPPKQEPVARAHEWQWARARAEGCTWAGPPRVRPAAPAWSVRRARRLWGLRGLRVPASPAIEVEELARVDPFPAQRTRLVSMLCPGLWLAARRPSGPACSPGPRAAQPPRPRSPRRPPSAAWRAVCARSRHRGERARAPLAAAAVIVGSLRR